MRNYMNGKCDDRKQIIMGIEKFTAGGREVTLYISEKPDSPLIVMNSYQGDGRAVLEEVRKISSVDFSLLNVSVADWNFDMTPWEIPPLPWEKEESASGGADEYLDILLGEIMPRGRDLLLGKPSKTGIIGYSLGGLFALYSLYKCDEFDLAGSVSGSLWYPGFAEYVFGYDMKTRPGKIYISLGDREARTKNQVLKTVQDNTEQIAAYYKELELNVTFEMNPGNHFREPEKRTAKAIERILNG